MVCPPRAAVLGSRTRVEAYNRTTTNPLTGEPDAGDPPVRFGGRGKVQSLAPTPIVPWAVTAGVLPGCARANAKPARIKQRACRGARFRYNSLAFQHGCTRGRAHSAKALSRCRWPIAFCN